MVFTITEIFPLFIQMKLFYMSVFFDFPLRYIFIRLVFVQLHICFYVNFFQILYLVYYCINIYCILTNLWKNVICIIQPCQTIITQRNRTFNWVNVFVEARFQKANFNCVEVKAFDTMTFNLLTISTTNPTSRLGFI